MINSLSELPAFCVNLDSRPDRWAAAQAEFARVSWPVKRWPGVVYATTPSRVVPKEHAGCLDSHRQLWQHCLDMQYPVMAVFEDDVVLASDFIDIFAAAVRELPDDWALWHLHASHAKTVPMGPRTVRVVSAMWGSHGYLLRPAACARLLGIPGYDTVDRRLSQGYLKAGGQPLGTALGSALCFQRGDDSDIPKSAQLSFWRKQREQFWR